MSFSGLANPFIQTYKYDSLDRIAEAKETVNGTQTWKQTYGYDQYGNRTAFYQIISSQVLAINNLTLPTVEPTTNRFSINQGYLYDKNGNVTADPASSGRTFTFNGDNKQTEVKNSSNYTIGKYFYDGEGKRVKKVTDTETTVFVYAAGKLIAEYSTATPPSNPTINYTATDQLGSPRILTDKFGQVVSRRDFMPFGEELYADGQNRTTGNKYSQTGQDSVRQRFTGYQKDIETDLDFAEARYYNNQHARFIAVDPLLASGKSANPQTFNRYIYTMNRPLILTDSTGLQAGACPEGVPGTGCAVVEEVIRVITNLFTSRSDFLLTGATNLSTFDAVNFQRAQNRIDATRGDGDAAEYGTRRLVGNQGPTVDSVMQQSTDSVRTANTISNSSIAINSSLLLIPTPGGSSTVTTNAGTSLPRNGAAAASAAAESTTNPRANWSFGTNKSPVKWANQMKNRDWTNDQITEAISQGKSFAATNKINPDNGATRYVHPETGKSVVIDNVTRQVIQVGRAGFRY